MCNREISGQITNVTLLHGEMVLQDFEGEGGFCGVSCECCPKEYGRLTNYRIIMLQDRAGGALYSTALLHDVTACSVGRQRPRWSAVLSLLIVGIVMVGLSSVGVTWWTIIMMLMGLMMMGLAVWIYFARRPTTITFFVKGATDSNNGFSLILSPILAMKLQHMYFAAKTSLIASTGTQVDQFFFFLDHHGLSCHD